MRSLHSHEFRRAPLWKASTGPVIWTTGPISPYCVEFAVVMSVDLKVVPRKRYLTVIAGKTQSVEFRRYFRLDIFALDAFIAGMTERVV